MITVGGWVAVGMREYGRFLTGLPMTQTPGVVRSRGGTLPNPEVVAGSIPLDDAERVLWEQLRDLGHSW
ncbi:hypothetical protein [Actinoplanes sp. NPDC049316]|uniref:hypothetical protein n=1 Tax=Actinoplanes sp. NPDC049316 TaxID=3154727 RepID=UPI00342FD792